MVGARGAYLSTSVAVLAGLVLEGGHGQLHLLEVALAVSVMVAPPVRRLEVWDCRGQ